jgi:hypothetical protein
MREYVKEGKELRKRLNGRRLWEWAEEVSKG